MKSKKIEEIYQLIVFRHFRKKAYNIFSRNFVNRKKFAKRKITNTNTNK